MTPFRIIACLGLGAAIGFAIPEAALTRAGLIEAKATDRIAPDLPALPVAPRYLPRTQPAPVIPGHIDPDRVG
jgi:hypothetical protein